MVKEAEAHAADDAKKRDTVEAVNQAEGVLHTTESQIAEYKDQLDAEALQAMQTKIADVRTMLADKDKHSAEDIRQAITEMQQQSLKLFVAVYQKVCIQRANPSWLYAYIHLFVQMSSQQGSSSSDSTSDEAKSEEQPKDGDEKKDKKDSA